jgi:hypothetical protein
MKVITSKLVKIIRIVEVVKNLNARNHVVLHAVLQIVIAVELNIIKNVEKLKIMVIVVAIM